MAPLWLIPLLKIRCFPYASQHEPLPKPEIYEQLEKQGLIELNPCVPPEPENGEIYFDWTLTDKGVVYCEAVTSLPLPERSWYIPGIIKT